MLEYDEFLGFPMALLEAKLEYTLKVLNFGVNTQVLGHKTRVLGLWESTLEYWGHKTRVLASGKSILEY